jgi:hypothetical protein
MPNEAKLKQMLQDLGAAFPPEALEKTDGRKNGRGFDTVGYKVAYIIQRLNAVAGLGGWRLHREVSVREVTAPSGRKGWEATTSVVLELVEWQAGSAVTYADAVGDGGGVSYTSEADARKMSTSSAIKKAASMMGCGWQAYAGELSDAPEAFETSTHADLPVAQVGTSRGPVAAPQQTPPGYVRSGQAVDTRPAQQTRSRLSSKQLSAIMSISRKLGVEPSAIRSRVKTQFGCQLEFISREQASQVIKSLDAQLNGNGSGHTGDAGEGLAS